MRFVERLRGRDNQIRVFIAIKAKGSGAVTTLDELCGVLNVQQRVEASGTISGISKNMKFAGFKAGDGPPAICVLTLRTV